MSTRVHEGKLVNHAHGVDGLAKEVRAQARALDGIQLGTDTFGLMNAWPRRTTLWHAGWRVMSGFDTTNFGAGHELDGAAAFYDAQMLGQSLANRVGRSRR